MPKKQQSLRKASTNKSRLNSASVSAAAAPKNPFDSVKVKNRSSVLGRRADKSQTSGGRARDSGHQLRERTLGLEYEHRHKPNVFSDRRRGAHDASLTEGERALLRFQRQRVKEFKEQQRDSETEGAGGVEGEAAAFTHGGRRLDELSDAKLRDVGFFAPDSDDDDDAPLDARSHFAGGGGLSGDWSTRLEQYRLLKELKKREREEAVEMTESADEAWRRLWESGVVAQAMRRGREGDAGGGKLAEWVEEDAGRAQKKQKKPQKPQTPSGGSGQSDGLDDFEDYERLLAELRLEARAEPTERLKTAEEAARAELQRLQRLEDARRARATPGFDVVDQGVDGDSRFEFQQYDDRDIDGDDDDGGGGDEEEEERGNGDGGPRARDAPSEASSDDSDGALFGALGADDSDGGDSDDGVLPFADVPFVLPVPRSYPALSRLLSARGATELDEVFSRLLASNDPRVDPRGREPYRRLYVLVAFHFGVCAGSDAVPHSYLEGLARHVRDLALKVPEVAARCAREAVREMLEGSEGHGGGRRPLEVEEMYVLRLLFALFPASDFTHAVLTPAMLLLAARLDAAPGAAEMDPSAAAAAAVALLAAKKCAEEAGKVLPEALNVARELRRFVEAEREKEGKEREAESETEKRRKRRGKVDMELLRALALEPLGQEEGEELGEEVEEEEEEEEEENPLEQHRAAMEAIEAALHHALRGLCRAAPKGGAFVELFSEFAFLPEIDAAVRSAQARRAPLRDQRPVLGIQTFEPKFEDPTQGTRTARTPAEMARKERELKRKLRKEKRGAMKELRRDAAFLAGKRERAERELREHRDVKTKEIMKMLRSQEHGAKEAKKAQQAILNSKKIL